MTDETTPFDTAGLHALFLLDKEQIRILDRLIDGKEIRTRQEALASLLKLADVQLKANGL